MFNCVLNEIFSSLENVALPIGTRVKDDWNKSLIASWAMRDAEICKTLVIAQRNQLTEQFSKLVIDSNLTAAAITAPLEKLLIYFCRFSPRTLQKRELRFQI